MSNRKKARRTNRDVNTHLARQAAATWWNGEPVRAVRGTAELADHPGERIDVALLSWMGRPMYLDDTDGIGWAKLTTGRGAPAWPHRNVTVKRGSVVLVDPDRIPRRTVTHADVCRAVLGEQLVEHHDPDGHEPVVVTYGNRSAG